MTRILLRLPWSTAMSPVLVPGLLHSCVQIYYRVQRLINNPSLLSLFHLSPLFTAQASSGGNIGRVFVPWLALGGAIHTDVSVLPMWIRYLEGPRQTEAIRSLFKWPLGPGNGSLIVERSLILTEALILDEKSRAIHQQFHELSVFNIWLCLDVAGARKIKNYILLCKTVIQIKRQ